MKIYGFTYNCDKCAIDNGRITSFIYAHGVLEDKCGYDIVYIPQYNSSLDFEEDIIEDVIFVFPNGDETKARLFVWSDRYHMKHGLCVDITDTESVKYAQKKWDRKDETN